MTVCSFFVEGKPIGKGRPRFWGGHAVTPPATRQKEAEIREVARCSLQDDWETAAYMSVRVDAGYPVPRSWSKAKKAAALEGIYRPGKPDLDNVVKLVLDALNGTAYDDDKQVVYISARKAYSETPGLRIALSTED